METGYGYVKKLRFFSSLAFGNGKQVFHYTHYLRRFGARYYDSGLSIWLSVDPMSDERSWISPYNYCQNNPVILVDPDGRTIYPPDNAFMALYGTAYSKIQSNSVYISTISGYNNQFNDLRFNTNNTGAFNGVTSTCGVYQNYKINGKVVSTQSFFETTIGLNPDNMQSEIGLVKTLLHEAVHAAGNINGISQPENHEGFDRQTVLNGLIEYNDSYSLGFSFENLEAISWSGCQDSPEFRNYISERAAQNNITYDEQFANWTIEVHAICDPQE